MKRLFLFTLSLIASLFVASCTNIDELSDDNSIAEFHILDHFPKIIELGATQIEGDVISIPIVYGQSKFPLRFYANLKITADIDKIVGIDFSQELCLESIDDQIKFYVMAKSGLTRTYYIKARVVDPNDNNFIYSDFTVKQVSPVTIISERGVVSTQGDTLKIHTVGGSYPISVTPEFTIDENSSFRNFENGKTKLQFDNTKSVHKIKVISKNGAERLWNIKLIHTPIIEGSDPNVSDTKRSTTNIDPREFSSAISQAGFAVDEYFVDNTKDQIVLTIKEAVVKGRAAAVTFPLDVDLRFTTFEGIELFNITNQQTISFSGYDDVKDFYMLDSFEEVSRKWTIRLKEWTGSSADVLAFNYTYVAANVKIKSTGTANTKSIVLDESNTEIYPNDGEIYIKAKSIAIEYFSDGLFGSGLGAQYNDKWKLTLTPSITLSKGSKIIAVNGEPISSTPISIIWASNMVAGGGKIGSWVAGRPNDCWTEPRTFTVQAEDGTTKIWTIKIREKDDNTKSDKCELLDFGFSRILPNYAQVDHLGTAIDHDQKLISVKMLEDEGCYPITIYPIYSISPYANAATQNGDGLVFQTDEQTQTFTITAQDGVTQDTWTVKLIPAPKLSLANITGFTINKSTPASFTFGLPSRDDETGIVALNLTGIGAFPLTVDYAMTISAGAKTSMPLRGSITFNSIQEQKSFAIISQTGTNKKWTVKLHYTPELQYANMDIWNGNTPAKPWSTANNSAVTGTTSEGRSNGKVAVLTSGTTLGKFAAGSIFLGEFKFDIGRGMNDPISLTYFGIPFRSTSRIKGIYADLLYEAGSGAVDYGSAVIELVNYNNAATDPSYEKYQYHGLYPNGDGPRSSGFANTATCVVKGEYFIGNAAGTTHRGTPIAVVNRGEWQNNVFIPIVYTDNEFPNYTHLHVVFSSSGRGANFEGTNGSRMKVDNVRIVYEE